MRERDLEDEINIYYELQAERRLIQAGYLESLFVDPPEPKDIEVIDFDLLVTA